MVQAEIGSRIGPAMSAAVRNFRADQESCDAPEPGGGDAEFDDRVLINRSLEGVAPLQIRKPICRFATSARRSGRKHPGSASMRGSTAFAAINKSPQTWQWRRVSRRWRCCQKRRTAACGLCSLIRPCFANMYYAAKCRDGRSRVIRVTTDAAATVRDLLFTIRFQSWRMRCADILSFVARNALLLLGPPKVWDGNYQFTTGFPVGSLWPGRSYVRHSRACILAPCSMVIAGALPVAFSGAVDDSRGDSAWVRTTRHWPDSARV